MPVHFDKIIQSLKYLAIGFFITGILVTEKVYAVETTVTHIRITKSPNLTRWVFDLTSSVNYQLAKVSESLQSSRWTFTLNNAKWVGTLPKNAVINTPIQSYQLKPLGKSSTQLMFNVNDKIHIKAYSLLPAGRYGHRLVVDFKQPSSVLPAVSKPTALLNTQLHVNTQLHAPATQPQSKITMSTQPVARKVVIVIDPGHGGKDPGAIGPGGHKEKTVVLAIAKILQHSLNQQPGFHAELTRSRDIFISLRERLAIARRQKADLFIAVHADAYKNTHAHGASIFALSERGATSEMARWLAEKENQSELVDGVFVEKDKVLRSVLLDLSQTHTISVSLEMGHTILNQLSNITRLHHARVEQAAFVVLKSPDIPSLLIETGFLSNHLQEKQLANPMYQRQIVAAIVHGIQQYFARHPAL